MIQLFGPRAKVKKRPVTLGPQGSAMESGYGEAAAAGGGIQPGAHPEYGKDVPFGNPFSQIGGLISKIMKAKKPKARL